MSARAAPKTRLVPKSSVNRALNALGDRWSLLVVQEAFLGATRFEEFHARLGGARSTLSSRLAALERHGVLMKKPHRAGGTRLTYHLTARGLGLFDAMMLMWGWAVRWGVAAGRAPTVFTHAACGEAMLPELRCGGCGELLTLHTCTYTRGPGAGMERLPVRRVHRRRRPDDEAPTIEPVDLLGDRWTALVIGAQYFGLYRFDEIQSVLGIAPNILTDRLRTLEGLGVFERRLYEMTPPRYQYRLTRKGQDLFPHALAMMTWGDTHLKDRTGPPVSVRHVCGEALNPRLSCSACKGRLTLETVSMKAGL